MTDDKKVGKNTSFLTFAYVLQKALAFLYFTFLARELGSTNVGTYVFAVSFALMFSILVDLGLSTVLTREVAKNKEKSEEYFSNIFTAKVILGLIMFIIVGLAIWLMGYPTLTLAMVLLAAISVIIDSLSNTVYSVFRGHHNLKYESIGISIYQITVVILGACFVFLKLPLFWLTFGLVIASLANFTFAQINLKRKIDLKFHWRLDHSSWKYLWVIAWPFALAGIFSKIYSYIDTVLISKLISDQAVGWYSVGYKITYAFQFIPSAFVAAIFPAMSSYFVESKKLLADLLAKSMWYLSVLVFPIVGGIFALSDQIVLKIYRPEFEPSILPLRILIWALIFIFLAFPLGSFLNASNRQKINTFNLGISMVINVVLNIILIPRFSIVGAAIAGLVSNAALFFLNLYQVNRAISYDHKFVWAKIGKSFLASLLMVMIVLIVKDKLPLLIIIVVGGLVYLGTILAIGGVRKMDIAEGLKSFRSKNI